MDTDTDKVIATTRELALELVKQGGELKGIFLRVEVPDDEPDNLFAGYSCTALLHIDGSHIVAIPTRAAILGLRRLDNGGDYRDSRYLSGVNNRLFDYYNNAVPLADWPAQEAALRVAMAAPADGDIWLLDPVDGERIATTAHIKNGELFVAMPYCVLEWLLQTR